MPHLPKVIEAGLMFIFIGIGFFAAMSYFFDEKPKKKVDVDLDEFEEKISNQ